MLEYLSEFSLEVSVVLFIVFSVVFCSKSSTKDDHGSDGTHLPSGKKPTNPPKKKVGSAVKTGMSEKVYESYGDKVCKLCGQKSIYKDQVRCTNVSCRGKMVKV